jgi:DedD protein
MDQGLKERLVGAAVLVAIAVWLIPWVLDGPDAGVEPAASSLQLPAAEEPMPIRTQTLRLGDAPQTPPPAALPAQEAKAAAPPPAEPPPRTEPASETTVAALHPEPEPPAQEPARAATPPPKPSAVAPAPAASAAAGDWAVQLGSFGAEANARRLAQQAQTYGYKAEVSSYRGSNGKTLYRVRVGPQATRAAAEAAASALRAHGIKDASVVAAR